MQLKIGQLLSPEFKSTFVCEIETMLGDCDEEETLQLKVQPDQVKQLEKLLHTLQNESCDEYHKVDGFYEFFVDHNQESGDNPDAIEWDHESDYDCYYSYRYHAYYWYDENGMKYKADIVNE